MPNAAGPPVVAGQTHPPRRLLIAQLTGPVRSFMATEAGSAGLLLGAVLIAMAWANSPISESYVSLWNTDATITVGGGEISMDLREWVNDGLMALFFFIVGLEVRRELSIGELRDRSRLRLPAIAAACGMLVPALIYLAFNPDGEAARGWAAVVGTDTAFLLGALALVGPACPTQLRVFLLTLTVFDDIGAVTIIAVAYSGPLDPVALAVAAACLAALAALSRLRQWRAAPYVVAGLALWVAAFESGLHPSIAGMLAGLLIAARPRDRSEVEQAASLFRAFRQSPLAEVGHSARRGLERAVSVNERLQTALHPWTSYAIVPLFALANAGVDLRGGLLGDALASPVTWGVVAGLVAGKFAGIGLGVLGARRLGLGALPVGVGTGRVLGGAALSGIGFTVSLLIIGLAFDTPALREQATVGVLLAAALSMLSGWLVFRLAALVRGDAGLPTVLASPVDPARDHIRGPLDAPLTLVEYADFECPFCGRATGMLRELRERFGDELRYVFRHLPLIDVHEHAELAGLAAEAAAAQGSFWEMHDELFAHQDELELEDLLGYADLLGLDVERFARDLTAALHGSRLREDVASAEASGARGTPTFFVGERRHVGAYDAQTLARALAGLRRAGTTQAAESP